ncbi:methylated-DNA--[protein]-cysteine S-methyltransferase [Streptococcus caprae]|uniref:Methylated-DNA--protein-cysteine methyltransferase n=1 Tax=Streptococcus caprae TaxID=1640501 RepID=A0ABV8CSI5_9STRE
MMLFKTLYHSPVGDLSLVADETGLVGCWFVGQAYFERGLTSQPIMRMSPVLDATCAWLDSYFAGECPSVELPLAAVGTDFQQKVWADLVEIPYGQTVTYKDLAEKRGCKSAQAIGGAVGKNPWSILIPCHRVVSSDGSLTGYAGGLDKKAWLLAHEGVSNIS